ncbi:MAG TPA: band 7 protein [Phycisphaerales bacterium]|nr:band 7 protein [Phycisphaerales bacterium]HCD34664.1 band 7 protein [Phycisphaerales bacterium]|tara:strand:+ start:250 stop:1830 length:1581 start_codon:yes stop_codon:yes gene_type:complete
MFKAIKIIVVLALLGGIGFLAFAWTINRVYVPVGQSLQLRYKGPLIFGERKMAKPGHFADEGEIGILAKLRGPGRHFYCPIWWERTRVADQIVNPGEVALVRSMLGSDLPEGQYMVDGDLGKTQYKGILRKVFGPGRYRVNPYAYEFRIVQTQKNTSGGQTKYAGWVHIPTGYVGVVTNLAGNPTTGAKAGIQDHVLPPGIYPINSKEQQVDIIEIGYRVAAVAVEKDVDRKGHVRLDDAGEPMIKSIESGINFPSNDGFDIHMDYTAIWGVMPQAAPEIIRTFGNVAAVQDKVVLPQIESICRNNGSSHAAVDLLVGEDRQKFQNEVSHAFERVLTEKHISLLYGLVRHIYIPREVREPIQNAFVADELKLTRDQEQLTAKEEALLKEAEQKVQLEREKIRAETEKMVAQAVAEGHKTVGETHAQTGKFVAEIDRKVAELQAQATVVIGQANAKSQQLSAEARAQKFKLAVAAFGSPEAYNRWIFASNLPEQVKLKLIYAGEGTFWTDLKEFAPAMLGKMVNEKK